MGTRSLTHIEDHGVVVATIYQQFDGYPSGVGAELKRIAGAVEIINGISEYETVGPHANGMGCLAAQIVGALKKDIGGVYLYAPGSSNCGEEFTYTLYEAAGRVHCRAAGHGFEYDGSLAEMPTETV